MIPREPRSERESSSEPTLGPDPVGAVWRAEAREGPLETQIVSSIRRILRAVDQSSRRLLETCGLSAPQLAALRLLERTGPMPPSALARALYLSHPTVTGILGRLETRGLVRREPGARDRRTVLVHLTAVGGELLSRAPSLLQERFQLELGRLAHWERLSILAHMERVAELLEAEHLDAAPHLVSKTEDLIGPVIGAARAPAADPNPISTSPPPQKLNR